LQIDLDNLRRHYASLSDPALLALDPEDLTEVARECYNTELFHRGLTRPEEPADDEPSNAEPVPQELTEWGESHRQFMSQVPWAKSAVRLHAFQFAPEAEEARDALEEAGIPCALASEASRVSQFELMVPAASFDAGQRVLNDQIFHPAFEDALEGHFAEFSDEELLSIDRESLLKTSRESFDNELRDRGLEEYVSELNGAGPDRDTTAGSTPNPDEFVFAATLLGAEAQVGQRVLQEAGIPCRLEEDDAPTPLEDYRGMRLLVPPDRFDEACKILEDNAAKIIEEVRGED